MKEVATTIRKKKKSSSRSLFYRVSAWLHLWLGLVSGIIMFIVCLTGCIWVFQDEITGILEPETKITVVNKPVLSPSALMRVADSVYPGKKGQKQEVKIFYGEYAEFSPEWKGKYMIEVSRSDDEKGEHFGKAYDGIWRCATYLVEVK